ncbi:hypothetical protein UlMin_035343 [Ulmus minor]
MENNGAGKFSWMPYRPPQSPSPASQRQLGDLYRRAGLEIPESFLEGPLGLTQFDQALGAASSLRFNVDDWTNNQQLGFRVPYGYGFGRFTDSPSSILDQFQGLNLQDNGGGFSYLEQCLEQSRMLRPNFVGGTYGAREINSSSWNRGENFLINCPPPLMGREPRRRPLMIPYSSYKEVYPDMVGDYCDKINCLVCTQSPRLERVLQNILAYSIHDHGHKIVLKLLNNSSLEEINLIIEEVLGVVGILMIDPHGNKVVQKVMELCCENQMAQIVLELTQSPVEHVNICLNIHGSYSVQKLLDHLTNRDQIRLVVRSLSSDIVSLIRNTNGSHVIQQCLKRFPYEDIKYVLEAVAKHCAQIATDKSGCCILQQCVEYSQEEIRERLVAQITRNALRLAIDRYGNYVVQHIMGLKIERFNSAILSRLRGSYMSLSCDKYGSNVVEKCFKECEKKTGIIIQEFLRSEDDVARLSIDPYGNYVMQKALAAAVSEGMFQHLVPLLSLVKKNASTLRNNPFGKKVIETYDSVLCNYPSVRKALESYEKLRERTRVRRHI